MKAYKGFHKDLTCRGYQFHEGIVNKTDKANCAQNGFHCAENPLDCLSYYPDWRNSVYYVVEAGGDLDEDAYDSKISCTQMRLIRKLSLYELLFEAVVYMARHPRRKWSCHVEKEVGTAKDGFVVVRGKNPKAYGEVGDIVALLKEKKRTADLEDVSLFVIDGQKYPMRAWHGIYGEVKEYECIAA